MMFSSVDKALVALIGAGVSALVAGGWLTADQGLQATEIVTALVGGAVTAFVTWLVPNKE